MNDHRSPALAARARSRHVSLRDYQVEFIGRLRAHTKDTLVESPTGSGKSLMLCTFLALDVGTRYTHAILAAPMRTIERGFVDVQGSIVRRPAALAAEEPIEISPGFIVTAREGTNGSRAELRRYFDEPAPGYVLACTHRAAGMFPESFLPKDMTSVCIVIDETHHAPTEGLELSRFTAACRRRGARIVGATATPYRADGRALFGEGVMKLRRSLAEHMRAGHAPRSLENEVVVLEPKPRLLSPKQVTGEEASIEVVKAIVDRWEDHGRPKAIVRVPPFRGGNVAVVEAILSAFRERGARVLDATGASSKRQKEVLDALDADRKRSFEESRIDVIVGCVRVVEGFDWPHASHVYSIGIPGTLGMSVQLVGRILRLKGPECPEPFRDRASITYFVPCAIGRTLDELSLDHSRHVLLTACYFADAEVACEWIVTERVKAGVAAAFGAAPETDDAEVAAREAADEGPGVASRAEIEVAIAGACQELEREGRELTLDRVRERARASRPDLPPADFDRIELEVLATLPGKLGREVRAEIERRVTEKLTKRKFQVDPQVRAALREVFAEVLDEFRDASLADSPLVGAVGRQIHRLTGDLAEKFAARLRDAAQGDLSLEQILADMDAFMAKYSRFPTRKDGGVEGRPGETWSGYEQALYKGHRGLEPGGLTLKELARLYRGALDTKKRRLTLALIRFRGTEHKNKHKVWPQRGQVEGEPKGERWENWEACVQQGLRGLPTRPSLRKVFARGGKLQSNRSLVLRARRTIKNVIEWIRDYHERTGGWPTEETDDPELREKTGETWRRLSKFCHEKGTTLVKLARRLGARNDNRPGDLDLVRLKRELFAFGREHGRWPSKATAGEIPGWRGEKWTNIDAALKTGRRGTNILPRPMSLSVFIARYCEGSKTLPPAASKRGRKEKS